MIKTSEIKQTINLVHLTFNCRYLPVQHLSTFLKQLILLKYSDVLLPLIPNQESFITLCLNVTKLCLRKI